MNKLKLIVLLSLSLLVVGAAAVNAQDADATPVITLERTACFGSCPVYTVSIFADGTVKYNGQDFVQVTGEQTSEIPAETVTQMVQAFEDAGYFDWNAEYKDMRVSDLSYITTSVTRDGETHKIEHYLGDDKAPLALSFLENWIDDVAGTGMWTGAQNDPAYIWNGTSSPSVTLQQTACFGKCPVYSVAVYADGTAVFSGVANTKVFGVKVVQADTGIVESIAQRAQIFGYFDWQDAYDKQVKTDQSTVITSVNYEDQSKRILRYGGDPNAPIGLVEIENAIAGLVTDLVS